LLQIPNTDSASQYLRLCKELNVEAHPARFPLKLPKFFVDFLTEPGDVVLDIFAGSNTTGLAAEVSQRRWIAFEKEHEYLAASIFRFLEKDVLKERAEAVLAQFEQKQETISIDTEHLAVELQELAAAEVAEPDSIEALQVCTV
jgi:DNA modification methylase